MTATRYSSILAFVLGVSFTVLLTYFLQTLDMRRRAYLSPPASRNLTPSLQEFVAADSRHQRRCEAVITRQGKGWSQFGQDWMLFHNIFRNRSAAGFYVDVGANHAVDLSNTFFFDRCLGWNGLCVEPNPQYWPSYLERNCTLVKKCISNARRNVTFQFDGVGGHVAATQAADSGTPNTECITLEQLLDSFHLQHIDLISLDVEGHEINILDRFNFTKYQIDVWTVETFWLNTRIFDRIMHKGGFSKLTGIHIDDIYVRRPQLLYPADWDKAEQHNDRFRKEILPAVLSEPVFRK